MCAQTTLYQACTTLPPKTNTNTLCATYVNDDKKEHAFLACISSRLSHPTWKTFCTRLLPSPHLPLTRYGWKSFHYWRYSHQTIPTTFDFAHSLRAHFTTRVHREWHIFLLRVNYNFKTFVSIFTLSLARANNIVQKTTVSIYQPFSSPHAT